MKEGAYIREATVEDAGKISLVQITSWRDTYRNIVPEDYLLGMDPERNAERWTRWLTPQQEGRKGQVILLAVEEEDNIVGFVSGGKEREDRRDYDAEVYALYLMPEHKGEGIGRALFRAIAERLHREGHRSLMVWVLAANPGRTFYRRMGGTEIDRKMIEIGGAALEEIACGWADITTILSA